MNWYYADGGEQRGPISQEQFDLLVAQGTITDTTLVWNDTLAGWQPWGQLRPATAPVSAAAIPVTAEPSAGAAPAPVPGGVRCVECGKLFPESDTVRFGNDLVCAACKPAYVQRLREGATRPGEMVFGTIWQRFLADFVDGLIVIAPLMILLMISTGVMGATVGPGGTPSTAFMAIQVLFQVVMYGGIVVYNTFMIGRYGYTLGKKALGLKVVQADGSPVSYGRACGRAFAEILSGLACYIGYIIAIFDKEKRSLHDHICNTRVVKR